VVELNQSGQYANLLQSVLGRKFKRFNKYDGLPLRVGDICKAVESLVETREGALAR
jgi:hypothetical protein